MHHDIHLEKIGGTIRRLRKDLGLTQAQLAAEAVRHGAPAVHRQDVSAMENGSFGGSVRKLQAVLRALRYTLSATVAELPTVDELGELFADDD